MAKDMLEIRDDLWAFGYRSDLCTFLCDGGYMIPSQWWFRLLLWVARKRHGSTRIMFFRLGVRAPDILDGIIEQTTNHVMAGGFDEAELAAIKAFLDITKPEPPHA